MTRNIFIFVVFTALLFVAVLPVSAQGLVTCGRIGQTFCDTCDIFALAQTILAFLWNPMAIVIAAGMMIYGGFYMILPYFGAGGAGMYDKGKHVLWNVVKGIVIVFFAWIAIDTIIKVVGGQNLASTTPGTIFGPWNKIQCTRAPSREPIALLGIPPELICPPGVTRKDAGGYNVCDPPVKEAVESMAVGEGQSLRTSSGGSASCTNGVLKPFQSNIEKWAAEYNLDPKRLQANIIAESGGRPDLPTGPAGEIGLSQMLPSTAKERLPELFDKSGAYIIDWLKDPKDGYSNNIKAGAALKRYLLNHPNTGGNERLANAAYNGGPGAAAPSAHCLATGSFPRLRRFECPWDELGCYGTSKTDCKKNEGGKSFHVTRAYYIPTTEGLYNKLKSGECNPY